MQNTSATGASTDYRQSIVVVVKQAMALLFIFYAPTNLFEISNGPGFWFYLTGFLNSSTKKYISKTHIDALFKLNTNSYLNGCQFSNDTRLHAFVPRQDS